MFWGLLRPCFCLRLRNRQHLRRVQALGHQLIETGLQSVAEFLQAQHLGGLRRDLAQDRLDGRFKVVRLLAQAHRAGQTRATLEGMQRPHAGIGPSCIAGAQQPFAQCTVQLRQQLARLFFEDREQLGLDLIGQTGFDLVRICAGRGRGQGLKGQLVQTRQQAVRPAERIHIGFVLVQRLQQLGIVSLQEAGGELVQQMAHMVARLHKQRHLGLAETAGTLRPGERVLQRPRQGGQIFVTHRRGIAGQCMRQGFGTARQRPSQLDGPFGQAGAQAARQLVGFIQEDIEKRDADAQRADQLDAVLRRFRRLLAHSFG